MEPLSPFGRENLLRLIKQQLQGRLWTVSDLHKTLRSLTKEISQIPLPPITGMELFVADGCNLDCTYCFEGQKPKRFLAPETARIALKRLIAEWSGDAKEVHIVFFGGEPLLNWRVCRLVIEEAEEQSSFQGKKVSFSLTTNGTLLNSERVRFLKEHQVAVMLSMDGIPAAHNRHRRTKKGLTSFHLVQRGLSLLQEHYESFDVRMTVMPDTASMLYESVAFLAEQGVKRIFVVPAFEVSWTPRDWLLYRQNVRKVVTDFGQPPLAAKANVSLVQDIFQVRSAMENSRAESEPKGVASFGCYAGISSVAVTAAGEVFPCAAFVGNQRLMENYLLGRVEEGRLNQFRRQEIFVLSRRRGVRCKECSLKRFCTGGCMVSNYHATGYLVEPDPITCWRTQLLLNLAKREVVPLNCSSFPSVG